jgi:hypothetical protein
VVVFIQRFCSFFSVARSNATNQPPKTMKTATNKSNVKKTITIYRVTGYEGRLDHYFGHKKEAERFILTHGLVATITPVLG